MTLWAASKKKQETKDSGRGKSMKCAQNAIRHLSGTSNGEKIKPAALAIISLHLSEGISQSVSQSVSQSAKNSTE